MNNPLPPAIQKGLKDGSMRQAACNGCGRRYVIHHSIDIANFYCPECENTMAERMKNHGD